MATCTLSGTLVDPAGVAVTNVVVKFKVLTPQTDTGNNFVVPKELKVTTNVSGVFTMTITQGLVGSLSLEYPPNATDSTYRLAYSITIPAAATATFPGIVVEL